MEKTTQRTDRSEGISETKNVGRPVSWRSRYLKQNRWISALAALIGMLAVLHLSVAILVDCLQILNIILAVIHAVLFGALMFATVSTRSDEEDDTTVPVDHSTGGDG